MPIQPNDELLMELYAEIEEAWESKRDDGAVDRLAKAHPELAGELYEFFSLLILDESGAQVPADFGQQAVEQTRRWLEQEGFERAEQRASASRPKSPSPPAAPASGTNSGPVSGRPAPEAGQGAEPISILEYLKTRTKKRPSQIVEEVQGASIEFLMLVSRYPHLVPEAVRRTLSERIESALGVPADELSPSWSSAPILAKAASRSEPYGNPPRSFEDLLTRSNLPLAARREWADLAHS